MAVDYIEVLGALGAIAAKHPQTIGLLATSYSAYQKVAPEIAKAKDEYQKAAAAAKGPIDQAAIAMQLAAMHPEVIAFLTQMLSTWQTRIPDLIQIVNEFAASSNAAVKT